MYHFERGKNIAFHLLATWHYQKLVGDYKTKSGLQKRYAHSIVDAVDRCRAVDVNGSHLFFEDLYANNYELLKNIIVGKPDELQQHSNVFFQKIVSGTYPEWYIINNDKKELTEFGKRIKDVFDYKTFSGKNSSYNAYQLCEKLGIDVCPYCNRNYVYTISFKGKGTVRPELDHFVEKSKNPILALSFYNLIPSCHICNASLKHAATYNFDDFLHPYLNSFHDAMEFSVRFKKKDITKTLSDVVKHFGVDFFYGDTEAFDLVIVPKKDAVISLVDRAIKHENTFKLELVYSYHKDLVQEIIQSAFIYNEDYIDSLYADFGGSLFRSREDVYQHATRNLSNVQKMPNRPFSKLNRDISIEFGLKY